MHSLRNAHPLMRLALAALFAVMSLVHGPLMSFARAGLASMHHQGDLAAPHAPHHHHMDASGTHAQPDGHHGDAADPDPTAIVAPCYAVGCFTALAPIVALRLPALLPLGQLSPALAAVMIPEEPDPAVPPPRLEV